MSYYTLDLGTNIKPFVEKKNIKTDYPESIKKEVLLLTVRMDQPPFFMGTASRRSQKFPGDIDLMETFFDCCSVEDVAQKFAASIKEVIKKISHLPLHYFSEFKAGLDLRYDVNIGNMENGVFRPNNELESISKVYLNKGLLNASEYNIIKEITSKGAKSYGDNEYDILNFIFRERKILRWSSEEIMAGIKEMPGGESISLEKALTMKTYVKIDMLASVNHKFIEITNFFLLAVQTEDGQLYSINLEYDITKEGYLNEALSKLLPADVEKLYFSNMYYSPMKMIKRLYTLAIQSNNSGLLRDVIPILGSSTSMLYQMKSELDTIVLILYKASTPPLNMIYEQIDEMRTRIASVVEIPVEGVKLLNLQIDNILKSQDIIEQIKELKKMIIAIINFQTISYLIKKNINPPVRYLPNKRKYSYLIRSPLDMPNNPYVSSLDETHGEGLYQNIMNVYRRSFCQGKARPLLEGEIHPLCANFEGPGTRIDLDYVRNYKPYNKVDTCARTHDLDYYSTKNMTKSEKEKAIREADNKFIKCVEPFRNEEPYYSIGLVGIAGKNLIENTNQKLAEQIFGRLHGHN